MHQIQVGYAGLSETDRRIMRELRDSGIGCELEGVVLSYLDSWDEQLARTAESGATVVNIVHVPSPPRRTRVFEVSTDDIAERCDASVVAPRSSACSSPTARPTPPGPSSR